MEANRFSFIHFCWISVGKNEVGMSHFKNRCFCSKSAMTAQRMSSLSRVKLLILEPMVSKCWI